MAVDLHRISTGISSGSSRNGFGNIVSFPSVAPAPFITYYDDYTQVTTTFYTTGKVYGDLIIANRIDDTNSANYINPPELGGQTLKVKFDSFDVFYDGAGGYYTQIADYGVSWSADANLFSNEYGSYSPFPRFVYITEGDIYFEDGTTHSYLSDGLGGFYLDDTQGAFYPYGTFIYRFPLNDPDHPNEPVYWDGTGGYYIDTD